MRFICGTFVKSLQEKFATSSNSKDDSKDFTDDTSAYARYKKRASKKQKAVVNDSVDLSAAENSHNTCASRETPL